MQNRIFYILVLMLIQIPLYSMDIERAEQQIVITAQELQKKLEKAITKDTRSLKILLKKHNAIIKMHQQSIIRSRNRSENSLDLPNIQTKAKEELRKKKAAVDRGIFNWASGRATLSGIILLGFGGGKLIWDGVRIYTGDDNDDGATLGEVVSSVSLGTLSLAGTGAGLLWQGLWNKPAKNAYAKAQANYLLIQNLINTAGIKELKEVGVSDYDDADDEDEEENDER